MEETNKLIAEFMGFEKDDYFINLDGEFEWGYKTPHGNHTIKLMKFNTSWDWIMPVVEKIETLEIVYEGIRKTTPNIRTENFNVSIFYQSEMMSYVYGLSGQRIRFDFNDVFELTRLEATHKAVVEFIKWYNKKYK